jgi:hypothetical protein
MIKTWKAPWRDEVTSGELPGKVRICAFHTTSESRPQNGNKWGNWHLVNLAARATSSPHLEAKDEN